MNLSIDYDKISESINNKKFLKRLIIGTALVTNLLPLFSKDILNTNAKLLLASTGFISALACCKLPDSSHEEKLQRTYKETSLKQYKLTLQGEILKTQTELEIDNQQSLAQTIERVPSHQVDYFAQKYGVSALLAKYYIDGENEPEREEEPIPDVVVSPKIFTTILERMERDNDTDLVWLKKALADSCFIAGKKGSGKSHLLRWLLAGYIVDCGELDLFYIIDKHYDPDSPWVFGVDETQLVERGRIVDGSGAIAKIQELHNTLLNRIENKLTYKKINSRVRTIIDEVDSYTTEEQEIISAFAKDVEYQGRKYGFSIHIGAHSIKKGEMGIDSSVLGSMLQILFSSVVLDRNSVLSGAFPTLPVLKKQIDRYKSQIPDEDKKRICVICDDSDVFIAHTPTLELVKINTHTQDSPQPAKTTTNSINYQESFQKIKAWCDDCFREYGKFPTDEEIKIGWQRLTGIDLSVEGLGLLKNKLGIGE